MKHVFIHWIFSFLVLITCKEPSCTRDEDCSDGCPEDFNGKCTAKCVDKDCFAEMIPQAEYFINDDKKCLIADDCKCSKDINGKCYPMCVKDRCTFKIVPDWREESEDEDICPKGTTCVDSFEEKGEKDSLNKQVRPEAVRPPKKSRPIKKQKAPKKKTKATKKQKAPYQPAKIKKRRKAIDGRNRRRQHSFNPISIKNRQMRVQKRKGPKNKRM